VFRHREPVQEGGQRIPAGWVEQWGSTPDFVRAFPAVSVLDTYHDFWDPRGEASPMKGSPDVTNGIRDIIRAAAASLNDSWRDESNVTNYVNPGASDYERKMVAQYESSVLPGYLFGSTRKKLTYREIINMTPEVRASYTSGFVKGNILEINNKTGETFKQLTQSERNTVGNFVLAYMFPGSPPIQGDTFGVTFDAGPVIVRRILNGIGVKNYIFPQNVADSAATDFNAMDNTQYMFPKTASKVRSNTFTNNSIEISYVDAGFGRLNPYGFKLQFKRTDGVTALIPFGPRQKDGPSVNYLVNSMIRLSRREALNRNDREKETIIDISPLQSIASTELILDLKRMGDYEQIAASRELPNVVFATIDIMCSFMARLLRKSCMWSCNSTAELVLYRFETKDLTPEQAILQRFVSFAQEQLTRIRAIDFAVGREGQLDQCIAEFKKGMSAYYLTKASAGDGALMNNPFESGRFAPDILDQQSQVYFANLLTTYVMRFKFANMMEHAKYLKTMMLGLKSGIDALPVPINIPAFERLASMSYIDPLPADFTLLPGGVLMFGGVNISQQFETLRVGFRDAKELVDLSLTDAPIYQRLLTGLGNQMDRGANNSVFSVSKDAFDKFNASFREFIGIINPVSDRGGRSDQKTKAYQSLSKFFEQRNALLKSFWTKPGVAGPSMGDQLESLIDLPNNREVAELRADSRAMVAGIVNEFRAFVAAAAAPLEVVLEPPAFVPVPPAVLVGGGNANQYLDRADLLAEICSMAAAFTESIITSAINARAGRFLIDTDLVALERTLPLADKLALLDAQDTAGQMRDIAYHWEAGLLDMRDNSVQYYNELYEESNSDVFVSTLVSATTTPAGITFPVYVDVDPADRRVVPGRQDFGGLILLTQVKIEVRALLLLTLLDNRTRPDKTYTYFTTGPERKTSFASKTGWNQLSTFLDAYLRVINGGGTTLPPDVDRLLPAGSGSFTPGTAKKVSSDNDTRIVAMGKEQASARASKIDERAATARAERMGKFRRGGRTHRRRLPKLI